MVQVVHLGLDHPLAHLALDVAQTRFGVVEQIVRPYRSVLGEVIDDVVLAPLDPLTRDATRISQKSSS